MCSSTTITAAIQSVELAFTLHFSLGASGATRQASRCAVQLQLAADALFTTDAQIYVGLPAAIGGSNSERWYVYQHELKAVIDRIKRECNSYVGIMLWDASWYVTRILPLCSMRRQTHTSLHRDSFNMKDGRPYSAFVRESM